MGGWEGWEGRVRGGRELFVVPFTISAIHYRPTRPTFNGGLQFSPVRPLTLCRGEFRLFGLVEITTVEG
jgi:hypothetical protein